MQVEIFMATYNLTKHQRGKRSYLSLTVSQNERPQKHPREMALLTRNHWSLVFFSLLTFSKDIHGNKPPPKHPWSRTRSSALGRIGEGWTIDAIRLGSSAQAMDVDGSNQKSQGRFPTTVWMVLKTLVNNGVNYQAQLVNAGFLNHQP